MASAEMDGSRSKFRARARPITFLIFLLAALSSFAIAGNLHAQKFTVSVDRDTVSLGENVTLKMTFEGGSVRSLPALPQVANLRFSNANGRSTQASIVNGAMTSSETYTFTVTPTAAGVFTIPEITADIGGQAAVSQPIKLKVLPAGAAVPQSEIRSAFIKLVVPKTEVYVGEVLPVDLLLYFQAVRELQPPKFKEEGFMVSPKVVPGSQTSTPVNGQMFNVVPIKTYVIPAKAGDLPLGPATMIMSIPAPNARRDFFGNIADWRQVTLQSEPQTLHVLPLPSENVPPGFSGAVGSYTFNLSASPTNVAVGEPITVTVQISGRGAVDSVTLPEQKNWQGFKLYPPTSDFEPVQSDPLGITGVKTFKLTAVPESMDVKELPQFAFSYFDPDQKKYQSLTRPPVPLIVRPSAASLPAPMMSTAPSSENTGASDIAHIKARPGELAIIGAPLVARPWFIALQTVPALAWLSLLINRRQKEKLAGNPKLRRRRLVDRIVHDGMKQLKMAAQSNQPEEFFSILFRLLQEQLGERLDVPASAITEAVVDERLRPLGFSEETLELVGRLFQSCNQARYARQDGGEELLALASDFEQAIGEIRRIAV